MKETNINELENNMDEIQDCPKNEKKKRHGLESLIAFSLALVLLIGSSFAYFTDRASLSTQGTAGTVSIALDSDINLLDENGKDILNPGDIRSGSFTVTNMGNKSADIRTTIALTAYDRNGDPIDLQGSATTQSMYDLYLAGDVEYIEGRGNMPKAGAQPLQTKAINGNIITYSIPEYSLNGNSDLYDEVETLPASEPISLYGPGGFFRVSFGDNETIESDEPIVSYKKDCDFVLVFNTAAGNEFQGSVVRIDVIVEAKQYENTGAGWQLCEHENITVGSLSQGVVLPENVITTNGTINPGYEYTPSTDTSAATTAAIRGTVEIADSDYYPVVIGLFKDEGNSQTSFDVNNAFMSVELLENGEFEFANLEPNTSYILKTSVEGPSIAYTITTPEAGQAAVVHFSHN